MGHVVDEADEAARRQRQPLHPQRLPRQRVPLRAEPRRLRELVGVEDVVVRAIVVQPPRCHLAQQVAAGHYRELSTRPRVLALPALRVDKRTDQLQAGVPRRRAKAVVVAGVGVAVPAQATAALRAVQQRRVVLAATPAR